MEIIKVSNREYWNKIIRSFPHWDVYYLCEYAESLRLHGDGEPILFYQETDGYKGAYVAMKSDIACMLSFRKILPERKYFDLETPYGYGGLLWDGRCQKTDVNNFFGELTELCRKSGIVSQFFRFHPVLQNETLVSDQTKVLTEKKSIYMDLHPEVDIFQNMDTKNRNMIRKALRNEVKILSDQGEQVEEFLKIYEATMDMHKASSYYYFKRECFQYLIDHMSENIRFFYAIYEEKVISAAIVLYNNEFMNYHLSGTLPEYRKLASANLLLYEAALWGQERGLRSFHLGGGILPEDSLFGFKKQFNKNGFLDFYIGRTIFLPEVYQELVTMRANVDTAFNKNNHRLIQYRG